MADAHDWRKGRLMWEADATMSFADVGKVIGVSKQIVARKAKKEGWEKVSNQEDLARRAYDKADAMALSSPAQSSESVTEGPRAPAITLPADAPEGDAPYPPAVVADTATDLRAKVLDRHRREWPMVRNEAYKAIREKNFDLAKGAKIAAETLKIIQEGERKAWGLDAKEGDGNSVVKVVVERKEAD